MPKLIASLAMGLMLLSLLSGLVVAFAYYPSMAYESIQKMTYWVPFGAFFRQIHYFASEALLVVLLLHVALELAKKVLHLSVASWCWSIAALASVIALLFSGYVLKADQNAIAAAEVAFALLGDTLLLKDITVFYHKFYLWHIVFLPALFLYGIHRHIKTIYPEHTSFIAAIGITLITALFVAMPRDIGLLEKIDQLQGPWFFAGAERLLAFGAPPWIVNLFLALPLLLLVAHRTTTRTVVTKSLLALWGAVYIVLSLLP